MEEANRITKWLQDHLGLPSICADDLDSLRLHPRHGTLCRRLLDFLARSTLCSQKYPHVFAKEEYESSVESLVGKTRELDDITSQIRDYIRDHENEERELSYLRSRLKCLEDIQEVQRFSSKILEEIVNRPNWAISRVSSQIDEISFLSSKNLHSPYIAPVELDTISRSDDSTALMNRRMASVDEELKDLTTKANTLNQAISTQLTEIASTIAQVSEEDLHLREPSEHELVVFRIPEIEEEELDVDHEAKKLKDSNRKLAKNVIKLNLQLIDMKKSYETRRSNIIFSYKDQINRSSTLLKNLDELEAELNHI